MEKWIHESTGVVNRKIAYFSIDNVLWLKLIMSLKDIIFLQFISFHTVYTGLKLKI